MHWDSTSLGQEDGCAAGNMLLLEEEDLYRKGAGLSLQTILAAVNLGCTSLERCMGLGKLFSLLPGPPGSSHIMENL